MTAAAPLLTVIIPTYRRVEFLPRAIQSALGSAPNGDVEVIVVPNGSDSSWKSVAEQYKEERRVKWQPIKTAHANAARNHGMTQAKGKYIRFLDDDDYFYSEAACKQLIDLEIKGLHVSSAAIDILDHRGNPIRTWAPGNQTADFSTFCFSPKRLSQVTSLIFLTEKIAQHFWDESLPYSQDICWLIALCSHNEFEWVTYDSIVGAWIHHQSDRISLKSPSSHRKELVAKQLLTAYQLLLDSDKLNDERRYAIADALWEYTFSELFRNFPYWFKTAKSALAICPSYSCDISALLTSKVRPLSIYWHPYLALPVIASARYILSCLHSKSK